MKDESIPKKVLNGKFHNTRPVGKPRTTNNQGRHQEGHITDPRNTTMKDTSRRLRRMDESSEEGNGPEGALASWNELEFLSF